MPETQSDRANIAIAIERIARLSEDIVDFRRENKEDLKEAIARLKEEDIKPLREGLAKNQEFVDSASKVITKAKGGWMVLLGIGAIVGWMIPFWNQITSLFGHG